jgi:DNA-binding winged helix-turn-helix (wHTH) protein/TolB-like protein/Tfp pilus assembly protein PilF
MESIAKMQKASHPSYSFDDFAVDLTAGCLLRNGREVKLRPKSFETLRYLVENNGRLVSKDELMRALWPDSFVTENSLVKCMKDVRVALEDESQRYIRTVPKRGYIFTAELCDNSLATLEESYTDQVQGIRIVIEEEQEVAEEKASLKEGAEKLLAPAADSAWRRFRQNRMVQALSLVLIGFVVALSYYMTRGRSKPPVMAVPRTIAVLPFKPLVPDDRDESFEIGMADTLITRLSNLHQIIVRPISAVRGYTRLEQDPVEAGKAQRVDAVLDGSLQRAGDRLRVTVRLVSVPDGTPLWADKFDEKFADIFAVQDSISEKVAATLAFKLSADEKNQLARHYTEKPEAYQLYLRGRYYWSRRTEDGMKKAIEHFQQAIGLDPGYALAYVGVGDCYAWLAAGTMSPVEAVPKAKAAAKKALEIDDQLAEAHPIFAWTLFTYDRDWPGAEEEFKRGIELNPNYATARLWYWTYLERMGRFSEAQREMKRTLELDPISLANNSYVGRSLYYAGQYDQAIAQYQKTIEMDPTFALAQNLLGLAYVQQSRFKEAIALGEKTSTFAAASPDTLAYLGYAYAMSNDRPGAKKILERLAEQSQLRYVSPLNTAIVYLGLGDKDNAFDWLEKACAVRSPDMTTLKVDPIFKSIRSDERFTDLLHRVGLGD